MGDSNDGPRVLRFVVTGALLLSPMAGCGGSEDTINEPAPEQPTINELPEEDTINEPPPEEEEPPVEEPTVNEVAEEPEPEDDAPEQ